MRPRSRSPKRFAPEIDVLGNRPVRKDAEFLVHDADTGAGRFCRDRKSHRVPVDQDLARIRAILAAEDFHQRRFASAVLAAEGVHFGSAATEGDVDESRGPRKGLSYAAHLEARCSAIHGGRPVTRRA
jgi:hypothetical protein